MQTPPSALVSMMRGLAAAYTVVVVAYFPVASAGYAAFGNLVSPDVLLSVRKPAWLISLANFMVVIHLAASYQVTSPMSSPDVRCKYMVHVCDTMGDCTWLHPTTLFLHGGHALTANVWCMCRWDVSRTGKGSLTCQLSPVG